MTYTGPERRDHTDLTDALDSFTEEVRRLSRLIEGENGMVNRGIVGRLDDLTHTDAKLDASIQTLGSRVRTLEQRWQNLKWALVGYAAGGGILGGVMAAVILRATGG